ncbi:hypothetical protein BE21_02870 [Sorangium cellulosum]|uniref:Uncharacterized protein n=1 Tax=Sorangium cellulosum TaxID=56 RepID=A0A150TQS8_SORCE|nr:hypothetical protein BE21_02870 [Sorangium cellulosum]
MKNVLTVLVALGAVCLVGCEDKPQQVTPEPPKGATTTEAAKPAPKAAEPAKAAPVETAKPASTGGW